MLLHRSTQFNPVVCPGLPAEIAKQLERGGRLLRNPVSLGRERDGKAAVGGIRPPAGLAALSHEPWFADIGLGAVASPWTRNEVGRLAQKLGSDLINRLGGPRFALMEVKPSALDVAAHHVDPAIGRIAVAGTKLIERGC